MAYDAVVSGSALHTLKEWGEWEHNVRRFLKKAALRKWPTLITSLNNW
jgi:hypothetical protein